MTGMTEQTMWLIGGAAVFVAALIGFFVGRSPLGGKTKQVAVLEAEVSRQQEEIAGYKRDVESHFDKTATLVASMAGSYKDLFEHLSSGYEQLSSGSARQLFRDRVVSLLVGNAGATAATDVTPSDKVSAALIAAGAQPLERASMGQADGAAAESELEKAVAAATTEGAPAQEAEKSSSAGAATPAANASKPGGEEKAAAEEPVESAEKAAGAAAEGGQKGAGKDAGKDAGKGGSAARS